MVETMKLGFIGTGNMASAIMGGIIRNEVIPAEEIIGADLFAPGRERVKSQFGIHVTDSNKEVAQKAEAIILSVKPQFYADVIQDIKDEIKDNQIIITIAPGKTLSWLEEQFGKHRSHHAEYTSYGRRGNDGGMPESLSERRRNRLCKNASSEL